jgi:hypothetical protein
MRLAHTQGYHVGRGVIDDSDMCDGNKIRFVIYNRTDQHGWGGIQRVNAAEFLFHEISSFRVQAVMQLLQIF